MKRFPVPILVAVLIACLGYWAFAIVPVALEQLTGGPTAISLADKEIQDRGITAKFHEVCDYGNARYRAIYFTPDEQIDVYVTGGEVEKLTRSENLWKGRYGERSR